MVVLTAPTQEEMGVLEEVDMGVLAAAQAPRVESKDMEELVVLPYIAYKRRKYENNGRNSA